LRWRIYGHDYASVDIEVFDRVGRDELPGEDGLAALTWAIEGNL
jgi:hypothetical protein